MAWFLLIYGLKSSHMFLTRTLAKVLAFIGLFIGFSAEVLAQYGAPVYFFTFKGQVKDVECDQPVKNADVKLVNRNTGREYMATTDSLGNFQFMNERYRNYNEFRLIISDPDKRKNGYFKPTSSNVLVNDSYRYGAPEELDTMKSDIFLVEYVRGAPCDNEPELQKPKQDTAAIIPELLNPEDNTPENSNNDPIESGLNEFTKFNLYPNPNEGNFYLEFFSETADPVQIQVISMNGALVHFEEYECHTGMNKVDLLMNEVAPGTYHCILRSRNAMSNKPFVVQ